MDAKGNPIVDGELSPMGWPDLIERAKQEGAPPSLVERLKRLNFYSQQLQHPLREPKSFGAGKPYKRRKR